MTLHLITGTYRIVTFSQRNVIPTIIEFPLVDVFQLMILEREREKLL